MTEPRAGAAATPSAARHDLTREHVTAVVVTRGPTGFLPRTLAGLADQARLPQRVLVVDAAPAAQPGDLRAADGVGTVLAALAARVPTRVVTAPGVRTFGGAVRAALESEGAGEGEAGGTAGGEHAWLWLLHDDSAPEPGALAALVRAVEIAPSVAVAGAKQRTWDGPPRVVEVGVTTSRFGRRMTGIDEPEVDQGQHDARDDVLAVGTAGALVRRDVWDALGGTDPALGPFGDGLDLSRRARLAGHRVVVVPGAVVRHAQAALRGLREGWDDRRSARARREAFLHQQLVGVPALLVPVVAVLAVVSGAVRALGRVATKEPHLVVGELVAPWRVLARPGRIRRARRRLRATSVLPRRTLRPLEATWRDVVGQLRDRRLAAAEARRAATAPSELELRELAALCRRRRGTLAAVAVAAVAVDLVVLGRLVGQVVGGARLTGGSLLFGDADLTGLWRAATSWWATAGLGQPSPSEPFLAALLPFTAVTGGVGGATALLLLASLALAAVGAWFAAGAATRSVALRAWAALVWTAAPALLVGLEQARLGAVVAHVVLPWFLLGLARGVGAARTDTVLSGLVGARRLAPRAPDRSPDAAPALRPRPRFVLDDVDDGPEDLERAGEPAEVGGDTEPDQPGHDQPTDPEPDGPDPAPADPEPLDDAPGDLPSDLPPDLPSDLPPAGPLHPPATTTAEPSLVAAAAAALAFVVLTAAAPVLLPAGILLLLAVAPVARRRGRLAWVAVPALAVHGPVIAEAARTWPDGGWRLLLADPGAPVAAATAAPWRLLLGWPVDVPAWLDLSAWGVAGEVVPLAASGVVLLLALPALWLRAPVGRAARAGWVAVALGVAAAVVAGGTATGVVVGPDGTAAAATASPSPGLSLALAGALAAALLGATGVRTALARHPLGWRQAVAGVLALAGAVGPAAVLGAWTWHARTPDALAIAATDVPAVPTVGRQLQASAGLRVLLVEPAGEGVAATLLRGDGRQLTETTRAVELGRLLGDRDAADAEVAGVAARLAAGATSDAAAELAALGVGAVVVPPASTPEVGALAAALDATAGLERVTTTASGIAWRVAGGEPAWGRVGEDVIIGDDRRGRGEVPAGAGTRLLELAERADPGWQATLNGRPLRAVESAWRQAFEVPADAGRIRVAHAPAERRGWLALQGAVVAVTVLLAIPLRRRRGGAR
jgi:GT2 family glycosyltransferase